MILGEKKEAMDLLGNFCSSFCNSISSCLHLVCCCWLLQDCLPGLGRPDNYRNPPPGPLSGHHPRPTDPLVGPGTAPSHFGPPGGPPGVPGPLAGPSAEDPARFEQPGPPVPPGLPRY
ncbi:basic proline-rich protein-like [Heracleum sosnowskyi]|uniref:Basic proline-rich protein-like n=1 Tax=Heracleum sosnowskyi TaxID=360622 RepID=A0AAD8IKK2_9APIA|nr:basic proline-rich protein-like [Heracleum sosnowskyi]